MSVLVVLVYVCVCVCVWEGGLVKLMIFMFLYLNFE